MPCYSRQLSIGLRWSYKFNYKRHTYRSKSQFKTKFEAKRAESKLMAELDSQQVVREFNDFLLKDLVRERLNFVRTKKSKRYYRENEHYTNLLIDYLGENAKVLHITKNDVMKALLSYSDTLREQGNGNYAVNSMLRIIKALFNYGIEFIDLKMVNPCYKIQPFSVNQTVKYIPTDKEINEVLSLCKPKELKLILFVRDTYCRINEALNLTYADILKDQVVLYTHKSRNGDRVPRKVSKPDCIKFVFSKDKSERVFKEWNERPKFLEWYVKKLGHNQWSYHNLRHRGASLMSKQGKPIFDIMQKLGHHSLAVTQKYLQELL